ncbi:MAG TPA: hypothetical protein VGC65_01300 [Bacteroidia bacterium]|jgi:hypothetical protein
MKTLYGASLLGVLLIVFSNCKRDTEIPEKRKHLQIEVFAKNLETLGEWTSYLMTFFFVSEAVK